MVKLNVKRREPTPRAEAAALVHCFGSNRFYPQLMTHEGVDNLGVSGVCCMNALAIK